LPDDGHCAGLLLSGGGIIIGLIGALVVSLAERPGALYLLGGSGVCLIALLLILLPQLFGS